MESDRAMYGDVRMKTVERPLTISIEPKEDVILMAEQVVGYLRMTMGVQAMEESVEGVQRLFGSRFEITFRTEEQKDIFVDKTAPIVINEIQVDIKNQGRGKSVSFNSIPRYTLWTSYGGG